MTGRVTENQIKREKTQRGLRRVGWRGWVLDIILGFPYEYTAMQPTSFLSLNLYTKSKVKEKDSRAKSKQS